MNVCKIQTFELKTLDKFKVQLQPFHIRLQLFNFIFKLFLHETPQKSVKAFSIPYIFSCKVQKIKLFHH